jgi:hypothetical protein
MTTTMPGGSPQARLSPEIPEETPPFAETSDWSAPGPPAPAATLPLEERERLREIRESYARPEVVAAGLRKIEIDREIAALQQERKAL